MHIKNIQIHSVLCYEAKRRYFGSDVLCIEKMYIFI